MFRVFICYVMLGCCAVSCLNNFSAQSDSLLFCASDNNRLELELLIEMSIYTVL